MAFGARTASRVLVLFSRARRGEALSAPQIFGVVGATAELLLVFLQNALRLHDATLEVWVRLALVLITERSHSLLKPLNVLSELLILLDVLLGASTCREEPGFTVGKETNLIDGVLGPTASASFEIDTLGEFLVLGLQCHNRRVEHVIKILLTLISAVKLPDANLVSKTCNQHVLNALPLVMDLVAVVALAGAIELTVLHNTALSVSLHTVYHGGMLAALVLFLLLLLPLNVEFLLSCHDILILLQLLLLLLEFFILLSDRLVVRVFLGSILLSLFLSLLTSLGKS